MLLLPKEYYGLPIERISWFKDHVIYFFGRIFICDSFEFHFQLVTEQDQTICSLSYTCWNMQAYNLFCFMSFPILSFIKGNGLLRTNYFMELYYYSSILKWKSQWHIAFRDPCLSARKVILRSSLRHGFHLLLFQNTSFSSNRQTEASFAQQILTQLKPCQAKYCRQILRHSKGWQARRKL